MLFRSKQPPGKRTTLGAASFSFSTTSARQPPRLSAGISEAKESTSVPGKEKVSRICAVPPQASSHSQVNKRGTVVLSLIHISPGSQKGQQGNRPCRGCEIQLQLPGDIHGNAASRRYFQGGDCGVHYFITAVSFVFTAIPSLIFINHSASGPF